MSDFGKQYSTGWAYDLAKDVISTGEVYDNDAIEQSIENIIATIFEKEGKWVRQNVKINLSKEEKAQTGKHTIPRPDLDIVTYHPGKNEIEIWEVKSYLDSIGVQYKNVSKETDNTEGRYKILTSKKYRDIVIKRLLEDWTKEGIILKNPNIKIGLAAGKIKKSDEGKIKDYFDKKGWLLRNPSYISSALKALKDEPYENDPYIIAAKLIYRNIE